MMLKSHAIGSAMRWRLMSLIAAMSLGGTAAGQTASQDEQKPEPSEIAEVKPVSNSDTVTIEPGGTAPTSDDISKSMNTRSPSRRRRSSPDMQSAPKVSADDVLEQFERDRPKARPLLPGTRPGTEVVREPVANDDPRRSPARLPEGYFLVDRAGRLTRDGDWFVFNFTGDNNPGSTPDPPMRMLPNRMLERMIRESKGSTVSVEFIVSGEVTDFMGENHLLLRKLLRKRRVGNLSN